MALFDPIRTQEVWFEFSKQYYAQKTFSKDKINNGNIALNDLDVMISGILIHLDKEVHYIGERSLKWLNYAIDVKEEFGDAVEYYHFRLYSGKNMALWLSQPQGNHDVATCEAAYQLMSRDFYASDNEYLDEFMMAAYEAERFAEAVTSYEVIKGSDFNIKKASPAPRDALYANCKYRLDGSYKLDEVINISEKAMRRKMQEHWLGRGLYLDAANMLKVTYWNTGVIKSVKETLMKAYDLMPKVDEPPVPNPDDFKPKPKQSTYSGINLSFKM